MIAGEMRRNEKRRRRCICHTVGTMDNVVDPEFETAFHEAAHVFILLSYFPSVRFSISLKTDEQSNGRCDINPRDFNLLYHMYSDEQLRQDTMFSFAGDAAESILNGTDHPNPQHYERDVSEGRKRIDNALACSRNLSQDLKEMLWVRQKEYESDCFQRAKRIVSDNRTIVERIAKELIGARELSKAEIQQLAQSLW